MTTTRDLPGLDVSKATLDLLEAFEALARRWTEKINLVAPSTVPDLWTRHIADSAQLWPLAPQATKTWADLGSGGGFPGLVVAILAAEAGAPQVTLIESDQRKCAFLRTALRELGIKATILDQRAEAAPPQQADVVSARALAPLPTLLPLVARHLAPGGTALLPKGRDHATELDAARAAGWTFTAEALPSRTDPSARILRLRDLTHG
ncbi:rRNA small subunit methyltransferase, glucose inhibited division protein GidB [Rubellimicrobium mesophilum DSM 19309]|uniref:Ribosomal RNA small subunit methyltransferase G n=1 Tax=Rubellimicrobium mesophilum DSM 19309 TaxID=442562 RepID=A0A017HIH3_9RHOB|nr:16S rRNA (guanine(527)-N(7))-methyltransferase RsmG [Rubellimicrobium mesophilum]EYD74151.1 rRNA small subunit methyltransferase, glucose inhibited division protein GidB [Rubellimicrobium mesophilum DSM 19309]